MKRVFISYSRNDREFARRLAKSLTELGADVWIDYEDIPAGKKWSTAIQQGLDSSDGLLVLVSPDSMLSSNVEDEWQYFLDSGRPVIPILYKPAKLHFQLHRLQYVDFSTERFGDAFAKLLDELSTKGIPLQVETAEDTWIYDVKVRSKPPKKELEYIEDSKKATFPSIKVKKPILQKGKLDDTLPEKTIVDETRGSRSLLLMGMSLLLLLVFILALLLAWRELNPTQVQAEYEDFAAQPPNHYIYTEGIEVHQEANEEALLSFGEMEALERFYEGDTEWFQLYDYATGAIGYQTGDVLANYADWYSLRVVPVATTLSNTSLELFTSPSLQASSRLMEVAPEVLVYGYFYDSNNLLWYRLFVEEDQNGIVGWINSSEDILGVVWYAPVLSQTIAPADSYWSESLEADAYVLTIEAGQTLPIIAQQGTGYLAAYYTDAWYLLWIDGANLDINETTRQYLEQR